MTLLLGAHCIDTGGIPMAARRAGNGGMRALQIFSAIPKFYNDKVSVKPDRLARFVEALDAAGIAPPPDSRKSSSALPRLGWAASASTPGRPPTATATPRSPA